MISLTVISGRSGSGKSTALNVLEDMGYYCIDNLPVTLLAPLVERLSQVGEINRAAVSIDARNIAEDLKRLPDVLSQFSGADIEVKVVYLDSASPALVKRFSETRRKHPLSDEHRGLAEALEYESQLLAPVSDLAELTIDTTSMTIHELRDQVRSRVAVDKHEFALMFQSFAFRNGVPVDADFVFDVRSLPNPHWKPNLRNLTGRDEPVQTFLEEQPEFTGMYADIAAFLQKWLPTFEANNRSYVTIAIGCTGGQHRSVYMSEKLYTHFQKNLANVQVRHRELSRVQVDGTVNA